MGLYEQFCELIDNTPAFRDAVEWPLEDRPWYAECYLHEVVWQAMFPHEDHQQRAIEYLQEIIDQVKGGLNSVEQP